MSFSTRCGKALTRLMAFPTRNLLALWSLDLYLSFLRFHRREDNLSQISRLDQKSLARANPRRILALNAYADLMILAVAFVSAGVITQDVLLCQVGGDLRKRVVEIADRPGNVRFAAGLRGERLHAPFSRQVAHVGVVVESGLHYIDLAFVRREPLQRRFKVMIFAAGGVAPV